MSYFQSPYLIHFGIKGQRWGVRRFQNEDRTLTAEGKERYNKASREERKAQKKAEKQAKKSAKPESSTWKAKDAKYLSDEELNRRNSRLQRESQYRQMTQSKGSKFLKGLGKNVNKILVASLVGAAAGVMAKHYKDMLMAGESFITDAAWMPIDLTNLR